MPNEPGSDGIQAQVLIELGKLSTSVAVANTKLDGLVARGDDHEARIRLLETASTTVTAGRDVWARVVAGLAVAAAVASAATGYFHK